MIKKKIAEEKKSCENIMNIYSVFLLVLFTDLCVIGCFMVYFIKMFASTLQLFSFHYICTSNVLSKYISLIICFVFLTLSERTFYSMFCILPVSSNKTFSGSYMVLFYFLIQNLRNKKYPIDYSTL